MALTQDDILDHIREIRCVRTWRQFTGAGDLIEARMIERFIRTFEEKPNDENR